MDPLLITIHDFEDYQDMSIHIQPDRIQPHINTAQVMGLRAVMGKAFYADLLAAYALISANTPLAANYLALMAYIKPYLCYYAYGEYLPFSNVVNTSYGSRTKTSQYSEPVPDATLALMAKNMLNKAAFYRKEMEDYLDEHRETTVDWPGFPLWKAEEYCKTRNTQGRTAVQAIRKGESRYCCDEDNEYRYRYYYR